MISPIYLQVNGRDDEEITAARTKQRAWIWAEDKAGNHGQFYPTRNQARGIMHVLGEWLAQPATIPCPETDTKPCACGDEIPADATRCAKCDEVGAKAEGDAE